MKNNLFFVFIVLVIIFSACDTTKQSGNVNLSLPEWINQTPTENDIMWTYSTTTNGPPTLYFRDVNGKEYQYIPIPARPTAKQDLRAEQTIYTDGNILKAINHKTGEITVLSE